jgi:hypothetical protein
MSDLRAKTRFPISLCLPDMGMAVLDSSISIRSFDVIFNSVENARIELLDLNMDVSG